MRGNVALSMAMIAVDMSSRGWNWSFFCCGYRRSKWTGNAICGARSTTIWSRSGREPGIPGISKLWAQKSFSFQCMAICIFQNMRTKSTDFTLDIVTKTVDKARHSDVGFFTNPCTYLVFNKMSVEFSNSQTSL
ncbi:unnamed protein product [Prunus armeniaca]